MKRWVSLLGAVTCVLALSACQNAGQNVYKHNEVGKTSLVNFGTVIQTREVQVQGQNTGVGALAGAAGGGIAGNQIGSGAGNAAATLGGVLVGAAIGALAEQAMADRKADEYVVTLETGATITVVQDRTEGDRPINAGDRVMVQLQGGTQRVLPANTLPTEIKRPKGIKVTD
jgi:outer membrane lipoprotein SlyB